MLFYNNYTYNNHKTTYNFIFKLRYLSDYELIMEMKFREGI